jgi:hypothetical protein
MENSSTVLVYGKSVLNQVGFVAAADGIVYTVLDDDFPGWLAGAPVGHEIVRMYLLYHQDHGKSPSCLGDLETYAGRYPKGYEAVKDGRWVVRWGTEVSPDPKVNRSRLLAHDRLLPSADNFHSRWAVFADNSACPVTASEFRDRNWERYEYLRLYRD